MTKDLIRVEVYEAQHEVAPQPSDRNIADVVPLRPEVSYLATSESVISASDERVLQARRLERARRIDFLRATSYLDYNIDAPDAELGDQVTDPEKASEQAWENVSNLMFTDGSTLSGEAILLANESGPAKPHIQLEIKRIFERIDRKQLFSHGAETNIDDEEEYRNALREKYLREAESYRKSLDLMVSDILDDSFRIELLDTTLTPEVLEEIREIFDIYPDDEAIKEIELERIAKEEKRKKVLAFLALLHDDDETPLPIG